MNDFTQLCVWPGTLLGESSIEDFENFFKEQGFRVKYAEEYKTLPDVKNGVIDEETGGRNDLLFFIHKDDVTKFAIPHIQMGISWWEDALANYGEIIPKSIKEKYPNTWE